MYGQSSGIQVTYSTAPPYAAQIQRVQAVNCWIAPEDLSKVFVYIFAVTLTAALNPRKPNAIQLLGKELVLWKDEAGEWVCMADKCSHRLAPLSGWFSRATPINAALCSSSNIVGRACFSRLQEAVFTWLLTIAEGRVENGNIMCAYHAWSFNSSGDLVDVPQAHHYGPDGNARACASRRGCVATFPVKVTSASHLAP